MRLIFIYSSKKKSTTSIICIFFYNFAVQKLSFIEHATNVFGPRSVLQANLSNEIISLSAYCHIHGTWVQQEVTQDSLQDSTYGHNKLGYLGWRPRDGCLLFEFLYLSDNELRTLKVSWCKQGK